MEPETRNQLQVVYLGDDSRKKPVGDWGQEDSKRKKERVFSSKLTLWVMSSVLLGIPGDNVGHMPQLSHRRCWVSGHLAGIIHCLKAAGRGITSSGTSCLSTVSSYLPFTLVCYNHILSNVVKPAWLTSSHNSTAQMTLLGKTITDNRI